MTIALAFIAVVAAGALANVDVARLRMNTAMRYITMGWFNEAIDHVTEAVKASPLDSETQMLLALLQHANGQADTALWQYDLAMQLDSEMEMLAVLMGDIHLASGRPDEAKAHYEKALAFRSDLGLAHYGLGRVFELQGDAAARDAYAEAVQYAPDMPDLRFRLGKLLRLDGQYEEALSHLLHANLLNSNLAHVRYELGLTYEALERFAAAEHEYRTVLRIVPEHAQARKRLAELPPF